MENDSPKNPQPPGNGDRPASISIPDHTLLRCIGSGSYGEVWLARNMMGTYRAIKIIYRRSFRDPKPYQRELSGIQKYEPVSRSYEGFVDVLHVGINEPEEYFYYIMELGDDETFGQKIKPESYAPRTLGKEIAARQTLPFQECLQLGLALSQALAELHKHKLVHRDIKPSNIIFVNGVPKLADIGLVADLGEARSYVGTEGFIPPEGPGTPQADIFSLGKVLYEASTGKDRQEFPALPTLVDKLPEHERFLELNEVILHACQNNLDKRYRAAWDMHADLLVLANGKSVRRLKLLERRVSSLKKMAGLAALILLILGVIGFEIYRERQSVLKARRDVMLADLAQGNRALDTGDPQGALAWYADAFAMDRDNKETVLEHCLRINSCLARIPRLRQMWALEDTISDACFPGDGKTVLLSWLYGKVGAYDVESGKAQGPLFPMGGGWILTSFSRDGQWLATTRQDPTVVEVRDATTREIKSRLPNTNIVIIAQFSPDGKHVATGCDNGTVRIFNAQSGELKKTITHHRERVRWVQFNSNSRLLVTASDDKTAVIWNTETGEQVGLVLNHDNWVKHASFSPDDRWLVTSSADRKAQVWDIASKGGDHHVLYELLHEAGVEHAEFSPDGQMLVTASLDGLVRLWNVNDLRSPNPYLKLRHGHGAHATHSCFSPDSRRLMTICADGGVYVWDFAGMTVPALPLDGRVSPDGSIWLSVSESGATLRETLTSKVIGQINASDEHFSRVEFSRDHRFVAFLSSHQTDSMGKKLVVEVQDITGKNAKQIFAVAYDNPNIVLNDDGSRLATFAGTNMDVWEVRSGNKLASLSQATDVVQVLFNKTGNRLAVGTGKFFRIFDLATREEVCAPLMHAHPVVHAEYSRDESLLVTCCSARDVSPSYAQVWDARNGKEVGYRLDHSDGIIDVTLSPDGSKVATAGEDFNAIVWDYLNGKPTIPLLRHNHQIHKIRFTPNGKWIVTASSDKSTRIWDCRTGNPLTPPLKHLAPLEDAEFLDGGPHIVTTDMQNQSIVWELPTTDQFMTDAGSFARLLSADALGSAYEVLSRNASAVLWQQLRAKYPSAFNVSEMEIQRWHENRIAELELNQNWAAAAFHRNQLLKAHPNDSIPTDRLARVKEQLEREHLKAARAP